jgi:hypothetical protein
MSENEQDALIGRMEAARRRGVQLTRLFLVLAGAGLIAGMGAGLYFALGG